MQILEVGTIRSPEFVTILETFTNIRLGLAAVMVALA